MIHLDLERLYAYLEGELEGSEVRGVEDHLAACGGCRAAAEERKLLLSAAGTLPPLEVPAEFALGVMERLSPAPAAIRPKAVGRMIAAAGAAVLIVAAGLTALFSGRALLEPFLDLTHIVWNSVQTLSAAVAKIARFITLAFKILPQIADRILETLKALTSFISPEALAAGASVSFIVLVVVGFLWNRRLTWERHHEK